MCNIHYSFFVYTPVLSLFLSFYDVVHWEVIQVYPAPLFLLLFPFFFILLPSPSSRIPFSICQYLFLNFNLVVMKRET